MGARVEAARGDTDNHMLDTFTEAPSLLNDAGENKTFIIGQTQRAIPSTQCDNVKQVALHILALWCHANAIKLCPNTNAEEINRVRTDKRKRESSPPNVDAKVCLNISLMKGKTYSNDTKDHLS